MVDTQDADARASQCLEDLREAVLRLDHGQHDRERREILDKLESLEILLFRGSARSLGEPGQDLEGDVQIRAYNTLSTECENSRLSQQRARLFGIEFRESHDGYLKDYLDTEDTLDSDDSFLRLSTMLERSISQGQEALSSPRSASPRTDARKEASRSPGPDSLSSNHFPVRGTSTLGEFDDEEPIQAGSSIRPRSPLSIFDDSEEEDLCSLPPEYMAVDSAIPKPQLTNSVIDEGLTALNGLIDQLTSSTAQRTEGGLTSSKALFLCSLVVLLVSFLVSSHNSELGVNCHCICPTMTTT